MSKLEQVLVCPYNKPLISKYSGFDMAVKTSDPKKVGEIYNAVSKHNNLYYVILETDKKLTDINFNWGDIPVALFTNGMGSVSDFVKKMNDIDNANVKFYLKGPEEIIYRDARILSSLGISCAIVIENNPNFECLGDLMQYNYYNILNHIGVDPFAYLADKYNREEYVNFKTVYFENPSKFLHIDENRNIAFSQKELSEGKFLIKASHKNWVEDMKSMPAYKERIYGGYKHFLKLDGCAYCEAYKICGGVFERVAKKGACKKFFSELLSGIEFVWQNKKKVKK